MRASHRIILPLSAVALLGLASGLMTEVAAADPQLFKQCGVVRAVTAPTSTEAGYVTLGTRIFQLDMSTRIDVSLLPIGEPRCVGGPTARSQIFVDGTAVSPVPTSVCGRFRGATPATSEFGLLGIGEDLVLKISPGTTLPPISDGSVICMGIALDAENDAIYAGVRQLPGTSTASTPEPLPPAVVAGAMLVVLASVVAAVRPMLRHLDA